MDAVALAHEPSVAPKVVNFRRDLDDLEPLFNLKSLRGQKEAAEANIAAIRLLKELDHSESQATPAQQQVLSRYVGWGGLAPVVDTYMARNVIEDRWDSWDEKARVWGKNWRPLYEDLEKIVSKAEISRIQSSVLTAFFTPPEGISAAWSLAEHLGFNGGTALEAGAGIGDVIGFMPENLRERTRFIAVEPEPISGGVLSHLYPQATIHRCGIQDAPIKDHSVDLVIGNFPFGDMKVKDPKSPDAATHSIHNYFFLKTMDKLRPGGLIIAFTSSFSMDASSTKWREAMAARADFLGGIRLPNTAFETNAGTSVVADLLVFRKKLDGPAMDTPAFTSVVPIEVDGKTVQINEYWHDHPEQVLGTFSLKGYPGNGLTVDPSRSAKSLHEQMVEALKAFPQNVTGEPARRTPSQTSLEVQKKVIKSDEKEGLLVLHEGVPRQVRRDGTGGKMLCHIWKDAGNPTTTPRERALAERMNIYLPLRNTLRHLIVEQLSEQSSDVRIAQLQADLNEQYDAFTEKGLHPINRNPKNADLAHDVEWPLVQALETQRVLEGPDGKPLKVYEKAPLFERRTIFPRQDPLEAESLEDALSISVAYRGRVDVGYIGSLLGLTPETIQAELTANLLAFRDPRTGHLEASSEYLSGFVRTKLEDARRAAEEDPQYMVNVEALEAVQPPKVPIQAISVRLGMGGWLPHKVLETFASDVLGFDARIHWSEAARTWSIERRGVTDYQKWTEWATTRVDAERLFVDCMSLQRTVVKDPVPGESGKYVVNQTDTIQAQVKQEAIEKAFTDWVKEHPTMAQLTEDAFNEIFNSVVRPEWPVPNLKHFPGSNQEIILEAYQKRAVARALRQSLMLAHVVGAGKTFTLISIAMEARRLGIAKKPMMVVQNNTFTQFVTAFRQLYPDANVLAPGINERDAANRQLLLAQIATGDYDAVVIPHSFFDLIGDDPERIERFVQDRLWVLEEALRGNTDRRVTSAVKGRIKFLEKMRDGITGGGVAAKKKSTQKQAQKAKDKAEGHIRNLLDRRTDKVLTFEQLGVDMLLVDEAHRYKRKDFFTRIDRSVKGVDKGSAMRSMGLDLKASYVRGKNSGRNVVLSTATPITNTIAELWTMMGYIRPDVAEKYSVESFDEFVGSFAQVTSELEMTYAGTFKQVTRLRKFANGPELLTMWAMAADNVRAEDITRQTLPRVKGGGIQVIDIEPTDTVEDAITYWRDELLAWQHADGATKRENPHIPILVMGRSRQISVDPRLVDPSTPDRGGSKIERAAQEIFRIWEEGKDQRLTQLLFCDLYRSPDYGAYTTKTELANIPRFNAYQAVKDKLIALGIPVDEIEIVSPTTRKNDETTAALFDRFKAGEIRVLMGSTQSLGVGVNVQDRLKAVHHLDLPLIPADLEQRDGRIVRAGNMNEEIEIYSYGVRRTLDAALAQLIFSKAKFIAQIMEGSFHEREFDDPSGAVALSAAEMIASYADDPTVYQKMKVEIELQRLRQQAYAHNEEKTSFRMRINATEESIRFLGRELVEHRSLADRVPTIRDVLAAHKDVFEAYSLEDVVADIRASARKLHPYLTSILDPINRRPASLEIGEYRITPVVEGAIRRVEVEKGKAVLEVPRVQINWTVEGVRPDLLNGRFDSGQGPMLLRSLEAALDKAVSRPDMTAVRLDQAQKTLITLREQIEAPFPRQKDLNDLTSELKTLNQVLEERGREKAQTSGLTRDNFDSVVAEETTGGETA